MSKRIPRSWKDNRSLALICFTLSALRNSHHEVYLLHSTGNVIVYAVLVTYINMTRQNTSILTTRAISPDTMKEWEGGERASMKFWVT